MSGIRDVPSPLVGEGQGGGEARRGGRPPTPSPSPQGGGESRWRLGSGGLIDRSRSLGFTFDGRGYRGHPGDTLASALIANGVRLVGRSFKYHRPRGILTAGPEEPNALVELRTGARREPNTRATTAELYDGLGAASQNRWPSLRFDLLSLNSLVAPVLSAGFYYKTFMWPASFWEKVYEPLIRRAAGLGRASGESDPDTYEKAFLHCDVLIVGGGPAGLMAALAAGRTGARVVLCDEDFRLGGRLLAESLVVGERSSAEWAAHIAAELAALPDVRILPRTTVVGSYDDGTYSALERVNDHLAEPPEHEPRQRLWRIFAKRCVLAAGAIERPLVFGDNDRPGVMLAGAVRAYLNRYAAAAGPQRRGIRRRRRDGAHGRRPVAGRRARGGDRRCAHGGAGQHRGCRQGDGCAAARWRRRRARDRLARGARGRCRERQRARPSASPAISSPCPAAGARRCI